MSAECALIVLGEIANFCHFDVKGDMTAKKVGGDVTIISGGCVTLDSLGEGSKVVAEDNVTVKEVDLWVNQISIRPELGSITVNGLTLSAELTPQVWAHLKLAYVAKLSSRIEFRFPVNQ